MPKDLTDASQWETVEVPVGTDPATASSIEPPFQILADRSKFLFDRLLSLWLENWQTTDVSGIGAFTFGVGHGIYEPSAEIHNYFAHNGTLLDEVVAPGGLIWSSGAMWAVMGDPLYCYAAHDGSGNRAQLTGLAVPPGANGVGYSAAWAAWVKWPGGDPSGQFTLVEHDHVGLWVITDVNGVIGTSGDLLVSTGSTAAFVVPTVAPGFAGGQGAMVLRHSHHPAGLLSPSDPGNQAFVALSALERSRSLDGQIWTAAAGHGWGRIPASLAYSAYGTRWIATLISGGVDGTIVTSDDNFSNATVAAILGNPSCPISSQITVPTDMQIACDGHGNWMLAIADSVGGALELHASRDNGVTWSQVYLPSIGYNTFIDLWYGGGRFMLATADGAGNVAIFTSYRSGE